MYDVTNKIFFPREKSFFHTLFYVLVNQVEDLIIISPEILTTEGPVIDPEPFYKELIICIHIVYNLKLHIMLT